MERKLNDVLKVVSVSEVQIIKRCLEGRHIPVGVDLFLACAFGMIVVKIHRLQMAGGFALFTQTVIHPDQDHQFDA